MSDCFNLASHTNENLWQHPASYKLSHVVLLVVLCSLIMSLSRLSYNFKHWCSHQLSYSTGPAIETGELHAEAVSTSQSSAISSHGVIS